MAAMGQGESDRAGDRGAAGVVRARAASAPVPARAAVWGLGGARRVTRGPLGAAVAVGVAMGLALSASAIPRDTVQFSSVPSGGTLGSARNAVRTLTIADSYTATMVTVSGTLREVSPETWASDARVRVTGSGGYSSTILQPFTSAGFNGVVTSPFVTAELSRPVAPAAGEWEFRFFEHFTDSDTGDDATWDTIRFDLLDDPTPPAWNEQGDAPEHWASAQACVGQGVQARIDGTLGVSDTDLYLIDICARDLFSASTIGGAEFDTQLYLFALDGTGLAYNDDAPGLGVLQSRLTPLHVPDSGQYYLAINTYGRRAVAANGLAIWADQPFDRERDPDGAARLEPLARWATFQGRPGGAYRIALTGVCFVQDTGCPADLDDGTGTGTRDGGVDVLDLIYFLALFEQGDTRGDLDDGSFTNTRDGAVDVNDLLYFLVRFDAGC